MIIKYWGYEASAKGLVGHGALQEHAREVASGCANYVVGLDIAPEILEAMKEAGAVGRYVTAESLDPTRIRQLYSENIPPGELAEKVRMFSIYAASAGIDRLRHLIFSHHEDEPVDSPMVGTHRQIISRVMRTDRCPRMGADHGDTDNDHGHDVIVTVDAATGRPIQFGQGWPKEAAQIAAAICEHRSGLTPEPNRRYVADETGVYHTFSDIRIADADGNILLDEDGQPDRALIRSVQKAADAIRKNNEAPVDRHPGDEWDLARAVELLAASRIKNAQSWEEVHRSLGRVGLRYVKVHTGAVIETVGHARDWADRSIAASAAYSNAALGKLSKRIGCGYEDPPEDLVVRPFVMPRYNPVKTNGSEAELRRNAKEQAEEIQAHLREVNQRRQQEIYTERLGQHTNDAIKKQAASAAAERKLAKEVARVAAPKRSHHDDVITGQGEGLPFHSCLWGGGINTVRPKKRRDEEELARRFQKRLCEAGIEYLLDGRVAFLETQNLIVLRGRDRQTRIDALKRAQAKFGTVGVMGRGKDAAELIELAAELGIRLDRSQEEQGRRHLERVQGHPKLSLLRRHEDDAKRMQRLKDGLRTLRQLKPSVRVDRRERRQRTREWTGYKVSLWRQANAVVDGRRKAPNPIGDAVNDAMRVLDRIERDELLLPSSRYQVSSVRYLDDERLQRAFKGQEHVLVRPELQLRLQAIELVQRQQRRWLCAAIISDHVTLATNGVVATRPDDQWAEAFYRRQRADPQFQRLLATARARPDRYANFDFARPELAVWRSLQEQQPFPSQLAGYVADELHRATTTQERDAFFRQMPYEEARKLRDAPGRFYREYLTKHYRDPQSLGRARRRPALSSSLE